MEGKLIYSPTPPHHCPVPDDDWWETNYQYIHDAVESIWKCPECGEYHTWRWHYSEAHSWYAWSRIDLSTNWQRFTNRKYIDLIKEYDENYQS